MQPKVFYLSELDPGTFPFKAKWNYNGHDLDGFVFTIIGPGSDGYVTKEYPDRIDIKANPSIGIGWTSEHDAAKMIDKAINNLFVPETV